MIQENLGVPTDAGYESDLKGIVQGIFSNKEI